MQPFILWSEGIDHVTIKIDVDNIINEEIDIKQKLVYIKFNKDHKDYEISIELYKNIISDESYYNNFRNIEIYLKKSEIIRWNKLTGINDSRINVDWSKNILDSDEELLVEELSDNEEIYSKDDDLEDEIIEELNDSLELVSESSLNVESLQI